MTLSEEYPALGSNKASFIPTRPKLISFIFVLRPVSTVPLSHASCLCAWAHACFKTSCKSCRKILSVTDQSPCLVTDGDHRAPLLPHSPDRQSREWTQQGATSCFVACIVQAAMRNVAHNMSENRAMKYFAPIVVIEEVNISKSIAITRIFSITFAQDLPYIGSFELFSQQSSSYNPTEDCSQISYNNSSLQNSLLYNDYMCLSHTFGYNSVPDLVVKATDF